MGFVWSYRARSGVFLREHIAAIFVGAGHDRVPLLVGRHWSTGVAFSIAELLPGIPKGAYQIEHSC